MTKRYTADDFANAMFAEHPNPECVDARFAARMNQSTAYPWLLDGVPGNSDAAMAERGWVPVPTKPTITESRYRFMVEGMGFDFKAGFNDALGEFGVEVIPDPEPTNADRLEELIISAPGNFEGVQAILKRPANVRAWAEYLDEQGVTAPNVKGN